MRLRKRGKVILVYESISIVCVTNNDVLLFIFRSVMRPGCFCRFDSLWVRPDI